MKFAVERSALVTTCLAALCLVGVPMAAIGLRDSLQVDAIEAGDIGTVDRLSEQEVASPDVLKALARHSILQGDEPIEYAIDRLESSLEGNPSQADAMALLAYAHALQTGEADKAANQALRESFSLCLLCDEDLTKWRLEFVLAYWPGIDEDNRMSAFEGADFLRWWHLEYAYIDQLRDHAEARGTPFSDYQRKVATPVRPNEVPRPAP